MNAYVDSSVVLRTVFGEKDTIKLPKALKQLVASELLRVECFRTIDRMRLGLAISDEDISERRALLYKAMRSIRFVKLGAPILDRACQPFPTTLKTLDAIHLSTALLWQKQEGEELAFLTHDEQLGRSARAMNFEVIGC